MILFEKEARAKILEGAKLVNDVVGKTMGAKGKTILVKRGGLLPFVTKDGITVARFVDSKDEEVKAGIQLIQEASMIANAEAGDGSTATIVLAYNMLRLGIDLINKDDSISPISFQRGMTKALSKVLEELDSMAIMNFKVNDIASISSNGDNVIADKITEAFDIISKDGILHIKESDTSETYIVHEEGLRIDKGLRNDIFVNKMDGTCEFKECLVLLVDGDIHTAEFVQPHALAARKMGLPFLIIAGRVGGEVESLFGRLNATGEFMSAIIEAPFQGTDRTRIMKDFAKLTGAKLISEVHGNLKHLGTSGRTIEERIDSAAKTHGTLKGFKANMESSLLMFSKDSKEYLEEIKGVKDDFTEKRIAMLGNKMATIFVGANSGVEAQEIVHRTEDAVNATKAALAEGIVAGGGVALNKAKDVINGMEFANNSEKQGAMMLMEACTSTSRQILHNAEVEYKIDSNKYPIGYDVKEGKTINLIENGIIDPLKVIKESLKSSVSVTSTVLGSGALILTE